MLAVTIVSTMLAAGFIGLLLIVLTLMRETMDLRGEVEALTSLITQPPEPTFLGKRVPEILAQRIRAAVENRSLEPIVAVLFLKENCEGCKMLVNEVQTAITQGRLSHKQIWTIVESYEDNAPIVVGASAISDVVIRDEDGALREACQVLGTPTIFAIRPDTLQLVEYELGGDAAWISRQVNQHRRSRAEAEVIDAQTEASIVEAYSGI